MHLGRPRAREDVDTTDRLIQNLGGPGVLQVG